MGLSGKEKAPNVKMSNVDNPKKQKQTKPKVNKPTENKPNQNKPTANEPNPNQSRPSQPNTNKPKQDNGTKQNNPKPNKPKDNPKQAKPNNNRPKQEKKSNDGMQKNKPNESTKPKTVNAARKQVRPIYAACATIANNTQVQTYTANMIKDLVGKFIGKDATQDKEHLKELDRLKSEMEKLKIGVADQNAKILESKDNELKTTCRRNDTLQREVLNLRKRVIAHQQSGKVSTELQKENEEMTKTIAKLEEERKSILAMKEEKEGEIAEIKKESESQKKDMNDLMKLVSKLAAENVSGEGTSSRTDQSEEMFQKMMALLEKASIQSEKKSQQNESDSSLGGDISTPNPFSNMPGPSNQSFSYPNMYQHIPNMGQALPNLAHPLSNMGQSLPNMGLNHTNMGLPQPSMGTPNVHMGHHYPNMGLQFPNMTPYPNVSQQFPNVSPQYPNMNHAFPNMFQQYPNMSSQVHNMVPQFPNFAQQSPMNNQPQAAVVPPPQDVPVQTTADKKTDQMTTPGPTDVDSATLSVNLMTSSDPSEKPTFKLNIVEKPNDLGDKQKKASVEKKEKKKVNENSEKISNATPGKSAAKSGKSKSGPSKDLWSQLEELKIKIKKTESSKKDLCEEVSTIVTGVTKATITSKEHFMVELSDCIKQINEIPNDGANASTSGSQSRKKSNPNSKKNTKIDGETPKNNLNEAPVNYPAENRPQKIYYNSNQNNGDASPICSEPCLTSEKRQFQDVSGKKTVGPNNDARLNENSDENNCSDTDEAASVSSEKISSSKNGKGKGGGGKNNRGDNSKVNIRGGKETAAKSCDQTNAAGSNPVKARAEPPVNSEPPNNETNPPTQAKKKNKKKKKKKSANQDEGNKGDLMSFDDSGDDDDVDDKDKVTPSKEKGVYASDETLERFIGKNIPSLMEAIVNKIDVNVKVKNCVLIAADGGNVIREKPVTLLDIIQFKQAHPNGVCVKHDVVKNN